jgi:F-type H+-transporting ATPase subunit delta
MRDTTIARNYAETLLTLATRAQNRAAWGKTLDDIAAGVRTDPTLRHFLESPRVSAAQKNEVLSKALGDRIPRLFLNFLRMLVRNRRQMLLPEIATEYRALLDQAEGRVHAAVTVAKPVSEAEIGTISEQLSRVLGRSVIPEIRVNPGIIGGVVVRVGDTVMDGSIRRRLQTLRGKMLTPRG